MTIWAWIGGKQRPLYAPRIITKGKNKGRVEAKYLRGIKAGERVYRKVVVRPEDITQSQQ